MIEMNSSMLLINLNILSHISNDMVKKNNLLTKTSKKNIKFRNEKKVLRIEGKTKYCNYILIYVISLKLTCITKQFTLKKIHRERVYFKLLIRMQKNSNFFKDKSEIIRWLTLVALSKPSLHIKQNTH